MKAITNESQDSDRDKREEKKIRNEQRLVSGKSKGEKDDGEGSDSWEDIDEEDGDLEGSDGF